MTYNKYSLHSRTYSNDLYKLKIERLNINVYKPNLILLNPQIQITFNHGHNIFHLINDQKNAPFARTMKRKTRVHTRFKDRPLSYIVRLVLVRFQPIPYPKYKRGGA